MRVMMFFLILLITLPTWAQSGDPASPSPGERDVTLAPGMGLVTVSAGQTATGERIPLPVIVITPTAPPTEIPSPTSILSPVIVPTLPPTATETATLEIILSPFPTDQPTGSTPAQPATLAETPPATPAETTLVTESAETPSTATPPSFQPTATLSPTETATLVSAVPVSPTLDSGFTSTPFPTALLFPTVDLGTAIVPTSPSIPAPLALPALATLDDGADDWFGSLNWTLQSHENGLAWAMVSTGSELLRWQTPIDLRGATAPVTLSFQSWLAGDGLAQVQISIDGLTWQPCAVVPASDGWTSVSSDLSRYVGSIILIAFLWQDTDSQTQNQWLVDNVLVAETAATARAPEQPILPTATTPGSTETTTTAPSPTPFLSEMPTVAPPIELTVEVTDTTSPISTTPPLSAATLFPTETVTSEGSPAPLTDEQPDGTQPADPSEDVTATPTFTITSSEIWQATATEAPTLMPAACEFDADNDGMVTERDLSMLGQAFLNTEVTETTTVFDLNGNHRIDIGDLQAMARYLQAMCHG